MRRSGIAFWVLIAALGGLLLGKALTLVVPKETAVEPLIFVNIPAEDAENEARRWQPFMDYLSSELGREVKLMTVTDYAAATEALKYAHADVVRYGTTSYVLAEKEIDIVPIASWAKEDGSLDTFQSYIIARPGMAVADLDGCSFAFVDIGSTTGYLLAATFMKVNDLEPAESFYAGSHPAVIEAVKNHSVDAGACASTRYELAVEEGVLKPEQVDIIWSSDPVPRGPFVVRKDMPEELRLALQEALFNAPPDLVGGLGLETDHLGPASPDLFDPMREAQRYLGLTSD